MSRMDADAIDLSKENIQPLRHGRKTHLLGLALQAETDNDVQQQLLKERDEYELLIRVYDGPDPLKPRYDYVLWLEQSYPKHGRDSNLIPLLEDTITMYKDDEKYQQDIRFVELIIKFIESQVNPLELYQVVYNLGIGTLCSVLYKSWAEELDRNGDLKRADKIFQLGLSNFAQPLEYLRQEHKQFQLSVGWRLLNGEDLQPKEEVNNENQRQVLGKLRTKVGSSRPTFGKAGVVPLCLSNRNIPTKSNAPISIYHDEESNENAVNSIDNFYTERLPKSDLAKKENTLKPGPWNKGYKTPRAHHSVFTPTTPKFKVHEDVESSAPMTPMSVCPSALKTRKAEAFHCPVAIFEPPDPSIKPMYCKNKIYVGGREFQFEEIQAAMYYKKMREKLCKEEMEKLGVKFSNTSLCFTTPQPIKKTSADIKEPETPFLSKKDEVATPLTLKGMNEAQTPATCDMLPSTPYVCKSKVSTLPYVNRGADEPVTPCIKEPMTPMVKKSDAHPFTPYQLQFQPVTPFDLRSQTITEVDMEGAETTKKVLPSTQKQTQSNKQDLFDSKLAPIKPSESGSNVKKFLNFEIYCDDE